MPDCGFLENKLQELKEQYQQLSREFQCVPQLDHDALCRLLKQLRQECSQQELLLQNCTTHSRSPAIAALSQTQLSYCRRARQILEQEMPAYLHSEGSSLQQVQAESAALYAEYAVDFAALSARYALLAALSAIDVQMTCTEKGEPCYE